MRKVLLAVVAVVLLLLIIALMAGAFRDKTAPLDEVTITAIGMPENAEKLLLEVMDHPITELVPATLKARDQTLVSARILARIEQISVRSGDMVAAGDVIAQLDQKDLLSREAQASEQVNAASSRLDNTSAQYARVDELLEKKLIARADYDEARAQLDTSQADLTRARQALKESQVLLGFARIESPISGRVVDRLAEVGDTASPGMPLVSLYNPASVRVEANIREGLAVTLSPGQLLEVDIPSLAQTLPATIEEIVPAADPMSRSFQVKVGITYQPEFRPGMFARLKVPYGVESLILIPQAAVVHVGQLEVVWVTGPEGPQRRFIKTGRSFNGQLEVISGLIAGEQLLIAP